VSLIWQVKREVKEYIHPTKVADVYTIIYYSSAASSVGAARATA